MAEQPLHAEIARLRAALEPFARMAAAWDEANIRARGGVPENYDLRDSATVTISRGLEVTIGDYRRARAALDLLK